MRNLLHELLRKFRLENPQMMRWTDEEVQEALFVAAARQCPSKVACIGRRDDGKLIFRIKLSADTSDASR